MKHPGADLVNWMENNRDHYEDVWRVIRFNKALYDVGFCLCAMNTRGFSFSEDGVIFARILKDVLRILQQL